MYFASLLSLQGIKVRVNDVHKYLSKKYHQIYNIFVHRRVLSTVFSAGTVQHEVSTTRLHSTHIRPTLLAYHSFKS